MKKRKKNQRNSFKEFIHGWKPILIFSFIINIVLLIYVYTIKNSFHTYLFSGMDEYLNVKSGVINVNYDINLFEGNNVEYINEKDYKIKKLKIGYYVKDGDNLEEIISFQEEYDDNVSLKGTIKEIDILNGWGNKEKFNKRVKNNIENELYIVLEAKSIDNEDIVDKLKLDVSKLK